MSILPLFYLIKAKKIYLKSKRAQMPFQLTPIVYNAMAYSSNEYREDIQMCKCVNIFFNNHIHAI